MNIYEAMIAIMRDVEAIKKEKTNTQGSGFKYRGIDDVMNNLHDLFAKHGVFVMPEVLERVEVDRVSKSGGGLIYSTQKIRFTFYCEDGTSVSSIVTGTAMDSGDKADNKGISVALKYALLQAFMIPTEDMLDPDAVTHEVAAKPSPVPPSENQWMKIIQRLNAGELDLIKQVKATYKLTSEQISTLNEYIK